MKKSTKTIYCERLLVILEDKWPMWVPHTGRLVSCINGCQNYKQNDFLTWVYAVISILSSEMVGLTF